MAHIWSRYSVNRKFKILKSGFVPGIEVWGDDSLSEVVEVNIIPRLYDIFNPDGKSDSMITKLCEDAKYADLADLLLHILEHVDVDSGQEFIDVLSNYISKNIQDGKYNLPMDEMPTYSEVFSLCSAKQKYWISFFLAKYYLGQERINYYESVMDVLFGIYYRRYEQETKILYLCLDEEKSETNDMIAKMLEYLFREIGSQVCPMWKGEYFGIIQGDKALVCGKLDYTRIV